MSDTSSGLASTRAFPGRRSTAWLAGVALLLAALVLQPGNAQLQPDGVSAQPGEPMPMSYFFDPVGTRSRAEVLALAPSAWRSLGGEPANFGLLPGTYWLKGLFKADERARQGDYVIEVANAHLSHLNVYIQGDANASTGAARSEWSLGNAQPFETRPLESRQFAVPVHVEPGESIGVLIRVATAGAIQAPVRVWPSREWASRNEARVQVDNLYAGLLLGVILAHLAMWLTTGHAVFLHHAAWELAMGFYVFSLNGSAFQRLWPHDFGWNLRVIPIAAACTAIFSAIFSFSFVQVRAARAWQKLARWGISGVGALICLVPFVMSYRIANQLALALVLVSAIACTVHTVMGLMEGSRAALYNAAGLGIVCLAAGVHALAKAGVLVASPWTDLNQVQLASLIEVVVVTFGLALLYKRHVGDRLQHQQEQLMHTRQATGESSQRLAQAANDLEARNRELSRMSLTDALTGLNNRRHFDERLAAELHRAAATRSELTVAMIDIDHFKRFNDQHGHVAGDACLKQVASAISAQLPRSADFLARYGGEEFGLILPNTGLQGGLIVCERIRQAMALVRIDVGDRLAGVSVSIGVLNLVPCESDSPTDLVRRADRALYQAKRSGRNRVCTASDNPGPATAG